MACESERIIQVEGYSYYIQQPSLIAMNITMTIYKKKFSLTKTKIDEIKNDFINFLKEQGVDTKDISDKGESAYENIHSLNYVVKSPELHLLNLLTKSVNEYGVKRKYKIWTNTHIKEYEENSDEVEEARVAAMKQAKIKAESAARFHDVELGTVKSVVEIPVEQIKKEYISDNCELLKDDPADIKLVPEGRYKKMGYRIQYYIK